MKRFCFVKASGHNTKKWPHCGPHEQLVQHFRKCLVFGLVNHAVENAKVL